VRASAGLLAFAVLAAGCGGGGTATATSSATSSTPKQEFVQQCGACHRLADAGTQGTLGQDLDTVKPTAAAVLKAIREGPSTMPADLVRGPYAQALADYVARVAGR
jgi:cytochrome c6